MLTLFASLASKPPSCDSLHPHDMAALEAWLRELVPSPASLSGVSCLRTLMSCFLVFLTPAEEDEDGFSPACPILHGPAAGQPLLLPGTAQWVGKQVWADTRATETGKSFDLSFLLLRTVSPEACPLVCKLEGISVSHSESRRGQTSNSCIGLKPFDDS